MAESRWISPSSIHTSLCLVASRLLPRPTKGPRVLQRGTGGPRSARASCPLSPRSVLRPQSRWGGVPEAKRLRGQATTYRLWGAPSLHAMRLRPLRFFGASSVRAPPSAIVRRGWAPRASRGSGASQVPQAAPSTLRSPPLPSCWFRGRG
ncbi:hypothetical protein NDU88_000837 [Pleurodeles waltl]|uniref:Uncharacterized protein n=1 Tax=Pleurodeles waltl TaxID=8319 RepID=A0AAV7WGM0_PLEWA|nr:hypothetical protein NDU88_000837 [Pleurodeles waltl]